MVNPREYTCRLLEMVDNGILSADDVMNAALLYMSDSDVGDMMHMNQWDDTTDEDGTEEHDSEEKDKEDGTIVGDVVIVDGMVFVAETGNDSCQGCVCVGEETLDKNLCRKLPDCDGLIFVRKGNK